MTKSSEALTVETDVEHLSGALVPKSLGPVALAGVSPDYDPSIIPDATRPQGNLRGYPKGTEHSNGPEVTNPRVFGERSLYKSEGRMFVADAPEWFAKKILTTPGAIRANESSTDRLESRFSPHDIDALGQDLPHGVTVFRVGEVHRTHRNSNQRGLAISIFKSPRGGTYFRQDRYFELDDTEREPGHVPINARALNIGSDIPSNTTNIRSQLFGGDSVAVRARAQRRVGVLFDDQDRVFLPSAKTLVEFNINNPGSVVEPVQATEIDNRTFVEIISRGRLPVALGDLEYFDHDINSEHIQMLYEPADSVQTIMRRFMQPLAEYIMNTPTYNHRLTEIAQSMLGSSSSDMIAHSEDNFTTGAALLDMATALLGRNLISGNDKIDDKSVVEMKSVELMWSTIEACDLQEKTGFNCRNDVATWIQEAYLGK